MGLKPWPGPLVNLLLVSTNWSNLDWRSSWIDWIYRIEKGVVPPPPTPPHIHTHTNFLWSLKPPTNTYTSENSTKKSSWKYYWIWSPHNKKNTVDKFLNWFSRRTTQYVILNSTNIWTFLRFCINDIYENLIRHLYICSKWILKKLLDLSYHAILNLVWILFHYRERWISWPWPWWHKLPCGSGRDERRRSHHHYKVL